MSDEEYAAFKAMIEKIHQEYNTPALATKFLQSTGMVDENGELAPQYRD